MPLRVSEGIPISPEGGVSGDMPGPPLLGDKLDIPPVVQQQSQWCWAACAEMVLTHYALHKDQCAIVAEKLALSDDSPHDCCGDNEVNFALVACENVLVDDVWRRLHIKSDLKADGVPPLDAPLGRVDFATIQDEIKNKRPIEVGIQWHIDRGGGHAVLIIGWTEKDGKPAVVVNDPLPTSLLGVNGQSGTLLLSELKKAFGHGKWIHTWTGLAPEENHE
jgi:hypothetical protein